MKKSDQLLNKPSDSDPTFDCPTAEEPISNSNQSADSRSEDVSDHGEMNSDREESSDSNEEDNEIEKQLVQMESPQPQSAPVPA